jgi:hypothetical protein
MIENQFQLKSSLLNEYVSLNSIRHCSLDFWNTIAYSNPRFKLYRAELLSSVFKGCLDELKISAAFEKVGSEYNRQQISGVKTTSSIELLRSVLSELRLLLSFSELSQLNAEINQLFLKYPPILNNSICQYIDKLVSTDITCSIMSNTAFISGEVIRNFLDNVGLKNKFSFTLFSDEVGFGKPNTPMYELLFSNIQQVFPGVRKSDILHIGDDQVSDFDGARRFGISAFKINPTIKLIHKRHAVHSIFDATAISFNPDDYSKFKFGDTAVANKFGMELFDYFKQNLFPLIIAKYKNFRIFSSPYSEIPTSSYYLTKSFYNAFQNFLIQNNWDNISLMYGKIERSQTYTVDYGSLNADERSALIKNDTYQFRDFPNTDDFCIFIDDISITGSHQSVVENMLVDNSILSPGIFLYYAELSNPTIPPSIENNLNYAFVNNLDNFMEVVFSDSYKVTTRATKFILSLSSSDFDSFINAIVRHRKFHIISEIADMSFSNGYHKIAQYNKNINLIQLFLSQFVTESFNLK